MLKRLLKVVELTLPEQRVVIFTISVLVGVVAVVTWRHGAKHSRDDMPPPALDQPSPSPGIRP